jgi:hypothetical protein
MNGGRCILILDRSLMVIVDPQTAADFGGGPDLRWAAFYQAGPE